MADDPSDVAQQTLESVASSGKGTKRVLPSILLMVGDVLETIAAALRQLAANTQRYHPGRNRPRPAHHVRPHARSAYKVKTA